MAGVRRPEDDAGFPGGADYQPEAAPCRTGPAGGRGCGLAGRRRMRSGRVGSGADRRKLAMKRGRPGSGAGKRWVVEGAFGRLGMQARAPEVVAALAQRGLMVGAEFVRLVRFGLLKAAARAR